MRQASGELFPTDTPIPASQMIGRQDDVRDVASALLNGTHLILAAPRRIGKTSVCDAAVTRCQGRGCYAAKVDLFRLADTAELAEALAIAVIANRSAARRLVRKAREVGRTALSVAQQAATLKMKSDLGEGIELALTPGLAQRDPTKALDLALELPDRVARADNKRLVLFFDEFQEVGGDRKPYGDPEAVTKRMRAIFQRTTNVSYLFAGSIEHVMRDLFAPAKRAFSGFGSFHELRPIEANEWTRGLARRFQDDDCVIEDRSLARIVELGEGHPRATMRIAQQAHLAAVQLETHEISAELVELGFQRAIEGDRPTMEQTVERIRQLNKHALPVARALAAATAVPSRIRPNERNRALAQLRTAGIVEHVARGEWRIIDPLFRHYLAALDPVP